MHKAINDLGGRARKFFNDFFVFYFPSNFSPGEGSPIVFLSSIHPHIIKSHFINSGGLNNWTDHFPGQMHTVYHQPRRVLGE